MDSSINRTNDDWKDKSPTDDELVKVLDIIPVWFQLAVALGVPIAQAEAYRDDNPSHIGGLYALRYWRDGKCDVAKFPPTWKFLLETVAITCGSQVAKRLEAIVSPVPPQLVGPHGGGTKNESSPSTVRRRIVSTPQSPGRSGGNVPPRTVRPSSRKTTGVVIVVIVLGICTYYWEPIGDSMKSTCTRIVDIIRDTFQSTPQKYTSSHTPVSSQEPLNTPSPIGETEDNAEEKEHPIDDKTVTLKKPTFNERRITVEVYRSNFYKWEWVHSAEAVDVATGISAKAQNYKSKSGAKEHARENLKAILLERGIIRKDNI